MSKRPAGTWLLMLVVLGIALLVTGSAYAVSVFAQVKPSFLTSDPAILAEQPAYMGAISNLGAMMWSAAAACSFLGALLLRGGPRKGRFLLASGLFSAMLALDDMFMLHEVVLPHHLHIPESLIYGVYILLAAAYILYFLRDILSSKDYPFLGAALLFLAVSIGMNRMGSLDPLAVFIKDSLKFTGIAFWLAYQARTAFQYIHECILPTPVVGAQTKTGGL